MNLIYIIIKREFLAKVKNKSFIVMTFLSPLLFVGIAVFVAFLANMKSDKKIIAIHDESQQFVKEFKTDEEYKYTDLSKIDVKFLKDSILNESYYGLIYIPKVDSINQLTQKVEFVSNDSPGIEYISDIEDIIAQKITNENYVNNNLDIQKIDKLKAAVSLQLKKTSGEDSLKGLNEIKLFLGGAFGYLIMMFIVVYGNFVMRSVIEEKTSRIIEIIISSVKPYQLMMGKIIGNSLAGILQFLIWTVLGLTLFLVLNVVFGIDTSAAPDVNSPEITSKMGEIKTYMSEIFKLPIATLLISFVFYFIGGYFLYSSLYAAIGSAVDNETDSQQFLLPIIMPLILGVYIGFFTVLKDPHGNIATIFSFIPFTSPIVMLMRIPFGVPIWQIALSLLILFATFLGIVYIAAKIYRVGILMYGKKPTWKELYKWLKY
ncbi:MAG: ABC transporter permease [Flavobacterium sp.]